SQLALDVAELLGATPAQLAQALEVPGGSSRDVDTAGPAGSEQVDVVEGSDATDDPSRSDAATADAFDGDAAGRDPWDLPAVADPFAVFTSGPSGQYAADPVEPDDPAVRRLLPAASDDAEVAEEFRRL